MSMDMSLYFSNSSDQVMKVEILAAKYSQVINPSSTAGPATLSICMTYKVTMTKGDDVRHRNYTPSKETDTLKLDLYFR